MIAPRTVVGIAGELELVGDTLDALVVRLDGLPNPFDHDVEDLTDLDVFATGFRMAWRAGLDVEGIATALAGELVDEAGATVAIVTITALKRREEGDR